MAAILGKERQGTVKSNNNKRQCELGWDGPGATAAPPRGDARNSSQSLLPALARSTRFYSLFVRLGNVIYNFGVDQLRC